MKKLFTILPLAAFVLFACNNPAATEVEAAPEVVCEEVVEEEEVVTKPTPAPAPARPATTTTTTPATTAAEQPAEAARPGATVEVADDAKVTRGEDDGARRRR